MSRFAPVALRLLVAWAMLLTPIVHAQAQTPTKPAVSDAFLTPQSVVAISLRPRQVLTNPALAMLPIEVAEAAGVKYIGMDPANIVRAIVVGEPLMGPTPYYAVVLQANQSWDLNRLSPELRSHTRGGKIAGRDCLVSLNPALPCFMVLKEKTLIAASQGMMEKLMNRDRPSAEGVLADLVAARQAGDDLYAAVDLKALQPLIELGLMQARQETPPEFQKFLEIPSLLESVELAVNLTGERPSSLVASAADSADAEKLEQLIVEGVQLARANMQAGMAAQLEQLRSSDDPVERAMAAYADRMSGNYGNAFAPKRDGERFVVFDTAGADGSQLASVAIIGVLVALLLPAVQAAREAARRTQSTNNIKMMMLAMLNYESARGQLPAQAICDANGKPLLSWRVAILPYLEEQALYDQFRLDEPWDSEHNRQLISKMPSVFVDPSATYSEEDSKSKSCYAAVEGPDKIMDGSAKGRGFRNITDGTSNTVAIVEVSNDAAPIWTKPEDWSPAPGNPLKGLGGRHPGGFIAGFCDGSVHFFSDAIDQDVWKALLTIDGNEVIGDF